MKKQKSLLVKQLDYKMQAYAVPYKTVSPASGWIKATRMALGMSLEQLGKKLSITRQSVLALEERERTGSITIKSLTEAAEALNMKLVYGLVPKDGSLQALIDRKAEELAKEIVMRTSHSMKLEDQENSQERLKEAIEEMKAELKSEMPKTLWN